MSINTISEYSCCINHFKQDIPKKYALYLMKTKITA